MGIEPITAHLEFGWRLIHNSKHQNLNGVYSQQQKWNLHGHHSTAAWNFSQQTEQNCMRNRPTRRVKDLGSAMETLDFGFKVSHNDIHSHWVGAGPQRQNWKINRNDTHGNVDAVQLYTTQNYWGISPQQHGISSNRHKSSDAVGVAFHPHELIESLDGYRPTATNTEFARALHLQDQVRYVDGYAPIIHLGIWMGRPIATDMVIGWVQAHKNMEQQTCKCASAHNNKMEFTWA